MTDDPIDTCTCFALGCTLPVVIEWDWLPMCREHMRMNAEFKAWLDGEGGFAEYSGLSFDIEREAWRRHMLDLARRRGRVQEQR